MTRPVKIHDTLSVNCSIIAIYFGYETLSTTLPIIIKPNVKVIFKKIDTWPKAGLYSVMLPWIRLIRYSLVPAMSKISTC